MRDSPTGRGEVLVLEARSAVLAPLVRALRRRGLEVERVDGLAALRAAFARAGGHDALVIAPDVPLTLAREAIATLRAVDPRLVVVTFDGGDGAAVPESDLHLAGLHPAAPVACGAIVRAMLVQRI
jgi:hypothetical protein